MSTFAHRVFSDTSSMASFRLLRRVDRSR